MTRHNGHHPKDQSAWVRKRYFWCWLIITLVVFIPIGVVLIRNASERGDQLLKNDGKTAHQWLKYALSAREYTWDVSERGRPLHTLVQQRDDAKRPSQSPQHYLDELRGFSASVCPDDKRELRSSKQLSTFAIVFGQFIDHDIILTKEVKEDAGLEYEIAVPRRDPVCSGSRPMKIHGVQRDTGRGNNEHGYANRRRSPQDYARELPAINFVTPELDLSQVYGSTREFAELYFREPGRCELKTGDRGDTLPLNVYQHSVEMANENEIVSDDEMLLAGDVRANEQWGLLAFHTWWVDLHNERCRELREDKHMRELCDKYGGDREDCYYAVARTQQIAIYQKIVYEEFLPALLGESNARDAQCSAYAVEDYDTPTSMFAETGAQLYRWHNMIPNDVVLADRQLRETRREKLCAAFFDPREFVSGSLSYRDILAGGITEPAMEMNECMVECLNGQLFDKSHCLDLGSLNMARYYIEDVASLDEVRETLGMSKARSYGDVISDRRTRDALRSTYGDEMSEAPLWILGSAEDHAPDSAMGETMTRAAAKQFSEFCKYDMFYYKRIHQDLLPKHELDKSSTMTEMLYKTRVVEQGALDGRDPFHHL